MNLHQTYKSTERLITYESTGRLASLAFGQAEVARLAGDVRRIMTERIRIHQTEIHPRSVLVPRSESLQRRQGRLQQHDQSCQTDQRWAATLRNGTPKISRARHLCRGHPRRTTRWDHGPRGLNCLGNGQTPSGLRVTAFGRAAPVRRSRDHLPAFSAPWLLLLS